MIRDLDLAAAKEKFGESQCRDRTQTVLSTTVWNVSPGRKRLSDTLIMACGFHRRASLCRSSAPAMVAVMTVRGRLCKAPIAVTTKAARVAWRKKMPTQARAKKSE
jgi:hypothetical protein